MLSYQSVDSSEEGISIIAMGGAGSNILKCFASSNAAHVRLCLMALDERLGQGCEHALFLQLGTEISHGMGSGGDPELGARAATESSEAVDALLRGQRLVVLIVGLGGGTGSGAAPVVAARARELGVFLVTVAVMPFAFEGPRRQQQAQQSLAALRRESDILFCFENDLMDDLFESHQGVRAVFDEANRLLARAAAAVPMLHSTPGLIQIGLDELQQVLSGTDSRCLFGSGNAQGENRAIRAVDEALQSPLLRYGRAIEQVDRLIVHISGSESLTLHEVKEAMAYLAGAVPARDLDIFLGTAIKSNMGDAVRVTLIAALHEESYQAVRLAASTPDAPEPEAEPIALKEEESDINIPTAPAVLATLPDMDHALAPELEEEQAEEEQPEPTSVEEKAEVEVEPIEPIAPVEQIETPDLPPVEAEEVQTTTEVEEEEATEENPTPAPTPTPAPRAQTMIQGDLLAFDAKSVYGDDDEPFIPPHYDDNEEEELPDYVPSALADEPSFFDDNDDLDIPPSLRNRH